MWRNCFFLILLMITAPQLVQADNWPHWRGPHLNGTADGKDYPVEWSLEKNILWKSEVPGYGCSTPVVWEDFIFLTTNTDEKNWVYCLNRQGEKQWQKELGKAREGKHKKASGANSSPVTDGKFVYVYFKSGDLVCLDFKGGIVWQTNLQKKFAEDTLWFDLGTSPVLTKDFVVVACIQSGPSYLVAFEKATGKVAWKVDRILNAPKEANQTYSSPIVYNENGEERIVVLGADHVTSYRADDGNQVWQVGGMNPDEDGYFRSISSPVVSSEMIVVPYSRGRTIRGIKRGGAGDVTKENVKWLLDIKKETSDIPTPVVTDDRVYYISDKGIMVALETLTGKIIWKEPVEKHRKVFSSSPTLVDGKIYATREDGTTFVFKAGDKYELLAKNELNEFTIATPVFVDGQILFRTSSQLYCIGQKKD